VTLSLLREAAAAAAVCVCAHEGNFVGKIKTSLQTDHRGPMWYNNNNYNNISNDGDVVTIVL